MWRSYYTVLCVVVGVQVFSPFGGSVTAIPVALPENEGRGGQENVPLLEPQRHRNLAAVPLPNSFTLINLPEEGLFPTFGNGTSLLRGQMQKRFQRVKRDVCKSRPETEIMEYYDLKLPGRCWDDCDCREGRYCTPHSWCHDINTKQP